MSSIVHCHRNMKKLVETSSQSWVPLWIANKVQVVLQIGMLATLKLTGCFEGSIYLVVKYNERHCYAPHFECIFEKNWNRRDEV